MNTLEMFEFPHFQGASVSINQDIPDLTSVGFLNKAQSLKINGEPWFVFSGINYKGNFRCFKGGNYPSIHTFEKISSVRHLKGDLYNPKITLYEHINYGGRSLTLDRPAASLQSYGFDNMASSHKHVHGAWILYAQKYYTDDQMVTLAGDEIPYYCPLGWHHGVCSLKPVQPYEAYSNAE